MTATVLKAEGVIASIARFELSIWQSKGINGGGEQPTPKSLKPPPAELLLALDWQNISHHPTNGSFVRPLQSKRRFAAKPQTAFLSLPMLSSADDRTYDPKLLRCKQNSLYGTVQKMRAISLIRDDRPHFGDMSSIATVLATGSFIARTLLEQQVLYLC